MTTAIVKAPSDTLYANQSLYPNQFLLSRNGKYKFIFQTDGNIVIYQGSHVVWGAGIDKRGGTIATMQNDGNFVVYNPQKKAIWATGPQLQGSYITMQDDDNLVVYAEPNRKHPVWSSRNGDLTRKSGGLFGDAFNWVSNVVSSAGRAVGQAVHAIATGAAAIGKALAKIPFVGPLLHGVWDGMTGILTVGDAILQGKRIDTALLDYMKAQIKDIKEIAPYVQMIIACVPGIGPIASAVIGTAIALAEGQSIGDALISGIVAAIPGGAVAKMAFEAGKAALQGKSLLEVGVAAVEGIVEAVGVPIPDIAKKLISTGVDMTQKLANGERLDKAMLETAASHLPSILGSAAGPLLEQAKGIIGGVLNEAGHAIESVAKPVLDAAGKVVDSMHIQINAQLQIADALLKHGQDIIPNLGDAAKKALHVGLTTGMSIGHAINLQGQTAKNLTSDKMLGALQQKGADLANQALSEAQKAASSAVNKAVADIEKAAQNAVLTAARNALPQNLHYGFDIGIGLMTHQIKPNDYMAIRNHLTANDKKGFDMATSLHVGRVAIRPPPTIKNQPVAAHAGYLMTFGMMGAAPTNKVAIMTTIAAHPEMKVGAVTAIKHTAELRQMDESWWEKFLELFGMGHSHLIAAAPAIK